MTLLLDQCKSAEFRETSAFINRLKRCPAQANAPFETDAEIVQLANGQFLVATTDTLSEEFAHKVICDPRTMGWLMITASASDMAALGVPPLGFVISVASPAHADREFLGLIAEGAQEACDAYQSWIFGGDSATAADWILTATAMAVVPHRPTITRVSSKGRLTPGDGVYLTGSVGWGNAVAVANFMAKTDAAKQQAQRLDAMYRPRARIKEGVLIAKLASSCMDTSDGLMMTLDFLTLASVHGIEFAFSPQLFHAVANDVATLSRIPPFFFAAAQNGEFELLFTASPQAEAELVGRLEEMGTPPLRIGSVTTAQGLFIKDRSGVRGLDLSPIRNLLHNNVPPERYVEEMVGYALNLGLCSSGDFG